MCVALYACIGGSLEFYHEHPSHFHQPGDPSPTRSWMSLEKVKSKTVPRISAWSPRKEIKATNVEDSDSTMQSKTLDDEKMFRGRRIHGFSVTMRFFSKSLTEEKCNDRLTAQEWEITGKRENEV